MSDILKKNTIRNFKMVYPSFYKQAATVKYIGDLQLIVTLDNGEVLLYEDVDNKIRYLPKDSMNMSKDEFLKEFGIRFEKMLIRKRLTVADVAKRSGIAQPLISRYVNRKVMPSAYALDRIAKALGCSMNDLTYRD